MVDIQNTNIRAGLDELDVSPPNTNLPKLDERTLSWVLPARVEWIQYNTLALRWSATTINGAAKQFRDDGGGTAGAAYVDQGSVNVPHEGRYYQTIQVTLAGGATTPISVAAQVSIQDFAGGGLVGYQFVNENLTNPGTYTFGPIYVPPIGLLQVSASAGGVGDTCLVRLLGASHPIGSPVSIIPGTVKP